MKNIKSHKEITKLNGAFNPCEEAKIAMARHNDDMRAGHKGADEYWLGQATAYGAMCANKKKRRN